MDISSKKKTLKEELEGKSLWEMSEWFDTHDTGEYDDEMPEVELEIVKPIKSRRFKDEKRMEEVLAKEAKEKMEQEFLTLLENNKAQLGESKYYQTKNSFETYKEWNTSMQNLVRLHAEQQGLFRQLGV